MFNHNLPDVSTPCQLIKVYYNYITLIIIIILHYIIHILYYYIYIILLVHYILHYIIITLHYIILHLLLHYIILHYICKSFYYTLEPLLSVLLSYGHLCLPDTSDWWLISYRYKKSMNKICKFFHVLLWEFDCGVEEIEHGNQEAVSASTACSS